jgi:hypothetical protein
MIQATLERLPQLSRLYDEFLLGRLVRRRQMDNYLLLLLVQPNDEYAIGFWSDLVDDLETLREAGSWEKFRAKLRNRERFSLLAARSELALAAWVRRRGAPVTIEPPTRGRYICDFSAITSPETWWEIKAVSDLDLVLRDESVAREVQLRLRRIDQPYVLHLRPSAIERSDVAKAIREIRRQLAESHRQNRKPPFAVEALGLGIDVSATTAQQHGYLGTLDSGLYVFGDEAALRIRDRVVAAVRQLPDGQACVVVIDTSLASFLDDHVVTDACL